MKAANLFQEFDLKMMLMLLAGLCGFWPNGEYICCFTSATLSWTIFSSLFFLLCKYAKGCWFLKPHSWDSKEINFQSFAWVWIFLELPDCLPHLHPRGTILKCELKDRGLWMLNWDQALTLTKLPEELGSEIVRKSYFSATVYPRAWGISWALTQAFQT